MPSYSGIGAKTCFVSSLRAFAFGMALGGGIQFAWPSAALSASFIVNATADTVDASPGDGTCADAGGFCTLRAAVLETNALAGADMISVPAGTYVLSLAGVGEDAAATGDLDVSDSLTIAGAGAAVTILDGGALDRVLHLVNPSQLTVSDVTIQHGQAGNEGGGLRAEPSATLIVQDSVITSNVVLESIVQSNAGGGVFCYASACSLIGTIVSDNQAPNFGGGIAGYFATVDITDCTVRGNVVAGTGGGGISLGGGGGTILGTTVSDNHAQGGEGGGVSIAAAATLRNCTISGNTASDGGGGVHGDSLTISNSTIAFNSSGAGGDGGGVLATGAGVTVRNSIISSNTDAGGEAPDCVGSVTSEGYNLVANATGCTIGGDLTGNVIGTMAKLSPLANHGGPTATHALLGGSPALQAGHPATPGSGGTTCEADDQRGFSRPQPAGGRCDIGAYEFVANQCGNYVTEGAEQCDDGNLTSDPCCAASCLLPTGCKQAGIALLRLKNDAADDGKDNLLWKWIHGDATTIGELGSPLTTTDYTLCLHAGAGALALDVPSGSSWQLLGTKGFKFGDQTGTPDGAQKVVLTVGAAGKSKARVKGKGENLPDTLTPMLTLPVTAQLINNENSTCFQSVFDAGDVIKNDATQFKAKTH